MEETTNRHKINGSGGDVGIGQVLQSLFIVVYDRLVIIFLSPSPMNPTEKFYLYIKILFFAPKDTS